MKLVCYIYEQSAAKSAIKLIARIVNRLPVQHAVLVYKAELRRSSIEDLAAKSGIRDKCTLISYGGEEWEFGAYQSGCDIFDKAERGILIINDTAGRNYPLFSADLCRFMESVASASSLERPIAVGSVDKAPRTFCLCDIEFDKWVRSNLFYVNSAAWELLEHRLFERKIFESPRYAEGRLTLRLPTSAEFENYIVRWMSPDPGVDGWISHAGRKNVSESLIRGKTGSILLEKRLSSRIISGGGELHDYLPEGKGWIYAIRFKMFFRMRRFRRLMTELGTFHWLE